MPRVLVPSAKDAAKRHPREFAILSQLDTSTDNSYIVDKKGLTTAAETLGDPSAAQSAASSEEVDFDMFASIFKKPAEVAEGEGNCLGWAAQDSSGIMSPFKVNRRELREQDVKIRITHSGICHTDLHQLRNEWGVSRYPMIAGHEIVGIVTEVGPAATKFQVGDRAAIGCITEACLECDQCNTGYQQFCRKGVVWTISHKFYDGTPTYGGFSTHHVIDERCALKVPDGLDLAAAAPLLCAGVTVYQPLRYFHLDKPGTRLAVLGMGGLGHLAVKLGVAMGCQVTVISRSRAKEAEAREMGAHHYLVSSDEEAMKAAAGSIDGIIDTLSAEHDYQGLVNLLDAHGKLVLVGLPPGKIAVAPNSLVGKQATIAGSSIGGLEITQEMLNFCAEKGVGATVEVIPISYINTAMERLEKGDVKFRFVVDIQGSLFD